ncbi:MAG: 2-oxo acid dehydrogenase subunit E2, partial [Steroidobacteraceae bacterium]
EPGDGVGGLRVAQLIEVRVPDIGDYKDVEVIDVAVRPGDTVALDGTLVTLETEKATMDVPSTAAGVVKQVAVDRGGRVSQGDLLALVEVAAGSAAPAAGASRPAPVAPAEPPVAATVPAATPAVAPTVVAAPPAAPTLAGPADPGFSRSHASPSIRRFARELGVDLTQVAGTGTKGRITELDVKAHVKRLLTTGAVAAPASALPKLPVVDVAAYGPVERKPLSRIQKIAGPRLHASWVNIPHVTQFDEADITDVEAARARMKGEAASRGVRLTPLAFVMRACVQALKTFPKFCTSLDLDAGELVYRRYMHIGFAADTPNGLVVPVVRDADRLDIYGLAEALGRLSEKARAGKLTAAEMQGGCFTISSLGGIGGTAFTPIINPPEVAILGVSRSSLKPVYSDGSFVPRLMLPLSLSYDHRVIDGADAARFTSFLGTALADVQALLEGRT